MRKHWLWYTVALLLAAIGLTACNDAAAEPECPRDPARVIERKQAKIADLESEIEGKSGGQVRDARDEINALRAEIRKLRNCKVPESSTTTTTTAPPEPTTVTVDPASLAGVFEGRVSPEELAFGEEAQAALANAPQERGAAAHSDRTLKSGPEIAAWLASDDPKAHPVRDRVFLQTAALCGQEDATRIMSGEGWLIMAVLPPSQVLGTSYMTEGGMVFSNSWRQAQGGDGYGLPVCLSGDNQGKVVTEAMVRLDCGNGHEAPRIRIKRPGIPDAPPVEVPPTPEEPPPSGGKDHRRSPISPDRNHPDERVRPEIPAPPVVIRPAPQPGDPAPQPPQPSTLPVNPPEVRNPEPIRGPGRPQPTIPSPVDPGEGDMDDGIPDD